MRRADRLFQIVQFLRARRIATATDMAGTLEVSERTIYRDIRDLVASGVPIEGEAGVGYRLSPRFDLPPLMFTRDELEALVLGARIVKSWSDAELARAADSLLSKVETVLPQKLRGRIDDSVLFVPSFHIPENVIADLAPLRGAISEQRKVRFGYTRADEKRSHRTVRPLALYFWGSKWSLTAWCELRSDFRSFRLDRMQRLRILDQEFRPEPGRSLEDYLAQVGVEDEGD